MKNIFLGFSILMTTAIFSQVDRSIVPTPGPAPEIHISEPVIFDLDNGMKVIISTNHKIPKVSFNLVMGSDPKLEGKKAGLSELMGSLLLSGTENRSKDSLDFEKDFIGATLYASSSSVFLNVLTKHLDKGLDLMTDIIQNANFPEEEFSRIKKQYESGLFAAKSDPNSMMSNAMQKAVFSNQHPYGEVMTEETLNNILRSDVIDFYKKQYTPAGSYLVIVGDIDADEAKKIAQDRFGDWEGGVPYKKDYNVGFGQKGKRVIFIEKPGAVQSVVSLSFPVNMKPGDDNQIKLEVLNKLFGGSGFETRLMRNLREDKAYTYGAYSDLDIDRNGSFLSANGNFRNEVTDSAIVEILYELDRVLADLPTEDEVELIKATMAGSFARSLESPRTIANFAYNIYRNELSKDYYKTYLQRLEEVSKNDILEMAQSYFSSENLNIIVVGNKDILDKLQKFDSDGTIEIFDAFGDPAVEKEYLPSELSKEDVLERYLIAVTNTKKIKKAMKKVAKIKTLEQVTTISIAQAGMKMEAQNYFKAPNMSVSKVVFSGMTLQEEIFNGTKGRTKIMNQSGGFDIEDFSDEDIDNKSKTSGVFTEYSFLKNNYSDYTLLGLEKREGKDPLYVIQYETGNKTVTDYYNSKTFLKEYSEKLEVSEDGPQSMSIIYSGYQNYKGYQFPSRTTQMIESMDMSGELKTLKINEKIDDKVFNLE